MNKLLSILFSFILLQKANGQSNNELISRKIESQMEYYLPKDKVDRNIETLFTNLLLGIEIFPKHPLTIAGGITFTHAWGYIRQCDSSFNKIKYSENVVGIGPVVHLKFEPFRYAGFSVSAYFSGGIIFYNKDFPTGGDFYNFIWKRGFSINYKLKKQFALNTSMQWMHISNGQGLGKFNPSYEGIGFGIGFIKYIKYPKRET